MISELILTPLKIINLDAGDILHIMKYSASGFKGFGEAYFSTVNHGQVKAWKKHNKMTVNLVVPIGQIGIAVHDLRENSCTNGEFFSISLSLNNYQRLTIPPRVWFGFKGLSEQNYLLNIASIEHDPSEIDTCDISSFDFCWDSFIL
jgi:dTDP-4-dehydrorhamnose 3,5-epimerase